MIESIAVNAIDPMLSKIMSVVSPSWYLTNSEFVMIKTLKKVSFLSPVVLVSWSPKLERCLELAHYLPREEETHKSHTKGFLHYLT